MKDISDFYTRQLNDWKLAGDNYDGLKSVVLKDFQINGHTWHAQFNPKRIISSSAKVDQKSISERPCFLCGHNRPAEQKGIPFGKYLILVNPYPVFHHHFTIPSLDHVPQRITGNFRTMLDLAKEMEGYTLVYNGPNCGASAPDHFHFQAIPGGILPIERYFPESAIQHMVSGNTTVYSWTDFLSNPVTLAGSDPDSLELTFMKVLDILEKFLPAKDEPMVNILSLYNKNAWTVHFFPRKAHRPAQYHQTGDDRILISPASIDTGGILVLPREEDFNKITAGTIQDIFSQVCADKNFIRELISKLPDK